MGAYAKAFVAGLTALLAVFTDAIQGSSAGGSTVTGNEIVLIVVATLLAGVATMAVPNSVGSVRRTPPSA